MNPETPATDLFARASRYQALWEAIAVSIRPHVSNETYTRWFSNLEITDADERELVLRVPNSIHRIWIESNYLQLLHDAVDITLGAPRRLRFVIRDEPGLSAFESPKPRSSSEISVVEMAPVTPQKGSTWGSLHSESESLANQAHEALRHSNGALAVKCFREAAKFEVQAFRLLPTDKTRTRGIIAVSGASLLYKAGMHLEASEFSKECLEKELLPEFARTELLEFLDRPPEMTAPASRYQALWEAISALIRPHVSKDTFARWFSALEITDSNEREMTLWVPSGNQPIWIESSNLQLLKDAVNVTLGGPRRLRFVIQKAPRLSTFGQSRPAASGLNPRFSFESFVVGPSNEFTHAAALAVAKKPAVAHNPLFMFGGVGLGKTHLMQAIGHSVAETMPGKKILYVTSEQFTNDYITALKEGEALNKFRRRYRAVDVLLLDDVQFFAGKEKTQDEFFHTFNELINAQKQIVLSCDRPPAEIGGLEQRLVSRFERGLTAEIIAPDMETRLAILRRKADGLQGVRVPEMALEFVATRVRANVRRLEGALMRIATHLSLKPGELSNEKLESLLRDILQEEARRVLTIEQIQRVVVEHYDLRQADMTSKRRPAAIAFPRQIAMYLSRELTKASLNEIGDAFGGRDHGSVIHAHQVIKMRLKEDENLRRTLRSFEQMLER